MDDGREMHPLACNHLCRIYTTIAKQYESNGNLNQYLSYLQKAYDHAKEGWSQFMIKVSFYSISFQVVF